MRIEHALDQHLDLAARVLAAVQARLDHARVVHDEHVARPSSDDVAKRRSSSAVRRRRAAAGSRALRGGMLRDQLGGQA
jgi:hypothetical protein